MRLEKETAQDDELTFTNTLPRHEGFSDFKQIKSHWHYPFSRETLRRDEIKGRFPKRIRLTSQRTVWPNEELRRYFDNPEQYRRT